MDVSDRRMQVQLTQEAKIASDFFFYRSNFCGCGLCQRSAAGNAKFSAAFSRKKTRPMAGKWPVGRALRPRQRMAARGKVLSSSSASPSGSTPSEASALCSEVTAAAVA